MQAELDIHRTYHHHGKGYSDFAYRWHCEACDARFTLEEHWVIPEERFNVHTFQR